MCDILRFAAMHNLSIWIVMTQMQTRANAEIVIFIKREVVCQEVRWAEHRIDAEE